MVVKRPDMFGFRNPGLMRVPLEQAIKGYESDCRNRTMHQMFLMIGVGERSGSGIPKIFSGWKAANWSTPLLHEKMESEQTLLELSIVNLVSDKVTEVLHSKFYEKVDKLCELERAIMAAAAAEGWVNHERACQLTSKHSREVTLALPKLVSNGFLEPHGEKRDKYYTLPGGRVITPDEIFAFNPSQSSHQQLEDAAPSDFIITSGENDACLQEMMPTKGVNDAYFEKMMPINGENDDYLEDGGHSSKVLRDEHGRFISCELSHPYIDDLSQLSNELRSRLEAIALPAKKKKRLPSEELDRIVIELCKGHFIPSGIIATLVGRSAKNFRAKLLTPLVDEGKLELAFPHAKRHKRQGYFTCE